MTLKDRVQALPPDRYARGAQAAARLAEKAALRDGLPVPEEASRILNKTLDELADGVRTRDAEKEAASTTEGSPQQASEPLACFVAASSVIGFGHWTQQAREDYSEAQYDAVMDALEHAGAYPPTADPHPVLFGPEVPASPLSSRVFSSVTRRLRTGRRVNVWFVDPVGKLDLSVSGGLLDVARERDTPST